MGETKKSFVVPTAILLSRSPFFEAACSEQRKNNEVSKEFGLKEDDPVVFGFYLHYVYTDTIYVGNTDDELLDGEARFSAHSKTFLRLVKTYALAEKLMDITTANIVIDAIIDYSDEERMVPNPCAVVAAFNSTADGSLLQRLMVDFYTHEAGAAAHEQISKNQDTPQAFLFAVLLAKARLEESNASRRIKFVFDSEFVITHRDEYHHREDSDPQCGDERRTSEVEDARMVRPHKSVRMILNPR